MDLASRPDASVDDGTAEDDTRSELETIRPIEPTRRIPISKTANPWLRLAE